MKRLLSTAALAAACVAAPAHAAVVLVFSPASTHIDIGNTVTIDVSITGLDAEVLSAVDINFLFEGSVAGLESNDFNSLGAALGAGHDLATDVLNPGGEVGVQANSVLPDADLAAQQLNNILLGSLTFKGLTDGVSILTLGADADFQRNFVGLNFASLDVQIGQACIAVGTGVCRTADVPEPAGYGLAGIALLAAGVATRRRKPTAA